MIALLVGRGEGAVSEVAQKLWESLSEQLVALIGQDGFHALYDRSQHLASTSFPWLSQAQANGGPRSRLEALSAALQGRAPDESQNAAVELLATFTGLLSSLIGHKLTTNILRAAWGDAFEKAVQDIAPWVKK